MTTPILTIGIPNSGKTTFIAQLYARLIVNNAFLNLYKPVDNLSPIIAALNRLANGDEVIPTPTDKTTGIELPIQFGTDKVDLFCPDYGGEQINNIIANREIDTRWAEAIAQSNNWVLFIRLSNLTTKFDLSNKTVKAETLVKVSAPSEEYIISDQAAYIELLQIMLNAKGQDAHFKNGDTKLTIVLTCWDEEKNGAKPIEKLKKHLPLLSTFVQTNWVVDKINIVGLSALGFSLKITENKELYQTNGAESYGYIIKADGTEVDDITQLISEAL